jgi:hypothetical protein
MASIPWLWLIGALAVVVCARPLSRLLIAGVLGPLVGKAGLAAQPDTIHLEPAPPDAWRDAANARQVATALGSLGFEEAGTFRIPELPGVTLLLLANGGEGMYAAVYEHDVAGSWFEFFMRYDDGTSATFTTCAPTGLDDRPRHPTFRFVGADPRTLFEQTRTRRPTGTLVPARAAEAIATFEHGYADSMAWRKARGITRVEVVKVATRRAA